MDEAAMDENVSYVVALAIYASLFLFFRWMR